MIWRTAAQNPDAYADWMAELVELTTQSGSLHLMKRVLGRIAETDPERLEPHADLLTEYAMQGGCRRVMTREVLADLAEYDPDIVADCIPALAPNITVANGDIIRELVTADPTLADGYIDEIANAELDDGTTASGRAWVKTMETLSQFYSGRLLDSVDRLVHYTDEDEYTNTTVEVAVKTLLRIALTDPQAVSPSVPALIESYRTYTEPDYRAGTLFAGLFTPILLDDPSAVSDLDSEAFVTAMLDPHETVFPGDTAADIDRDRIAALTDEDSETALMAHAVSIRLDLREQGTTAEFELTDVIDVVLESTGKRRDAGLIQLCEYDQTCVTDPIEARFEELIDLAGNTTGETRGTVLRFMRRHPRCSCSDPAAVPEAAVDEAIDALQSSHRAPRLRGLHLLLHTLPAHGSAPRSHLR